MSESSDPPVETTEIAQEHRALMSLVQEIDELPSRSGGRATDWVQQVASQLDELSDALISHFTKEETSDLYTVIPERFPDLAPALDRLRQEHREILTRLEEIRRCCHDEQAGAGKESISSQIKAAVDQLREHEAEETNIILWEYTRTRPREV